MVNRYWVLLASYYFLHYAVAKPKPVASCLGRSDGSQSRQGVSQDATVIVIRFHSVQVQFVYMYLYSVSIVGAVIGPVLYRSYLCVWVPPLPISPST